MPQAIGYIRVSTEEQSREGVSLAGQKAKVNAWVSLHDHDLIQIFEDAGLSGKRADNRPGLQLALDAACRHRCPLIVYSLSRLTRSVQDALTIAKRLEKHGADLVSLSECLDTTTAAGRMVFRMLSVLAEFERDQLSERTRMALGHLRDQGLRISGHPPYGYRLGEDGRHLVADEAEQSTLHDIVARRESGVSYGGIALHLTRAGIPPKAGKCWHPASVRAILKRSGLVTS